MSSVVAFLSAYGVRERDLGHRNLMGRHMQLSQLKHHHRAAFRCSFKTGPALLDALVYHVGVMSRNAAVLFMGWLAAHLVVVPLPRV